MQQFPANVHENTHILPTRPQLPVRHFRWPEGKKWAPAIFPGKQGNRAPTRADTRPPQSGPAMHGVVKQAIERERLRIARDIHDHVGQHLVGIMLRLAALEYRVPDPGLRAPLAELRAMIARFGEELKAVSAGSGFGIPRGRDLTAALEQLVTYWEHEVEVEIRLNHRVDGRVEPDDETAEVVYRVIQEALTNVVKHAVGASLVRIDLRWKPEMLQLKIEDNGPGLRAAPTPGVCNGIAGMRERVAALGGELEFRLPEIKGTRLLITVPARERTLWTKPRR